MSPSPSLGYELYTRGDYAALPANDTDLEVNYSTQDYIDVDAKDDVRVAQTATGEYAIHQFKDFIGEAGTVSLEWEGQSDLAATSSTIFLQIYNHDTPGWETVSSNNTASANTDFSLTGTIPDTTNYRDAQNIISCRVYQLSV